MSLNIAKATISPKSSTASGRVENGVYAARIVRVIDLGRQKQTDYKTQEVKTYDDGNPMIKPEVWVDFEFPTERIEVNGEDRPRWLGKSLVISAHEKSGLYQVMRAAGLDPKRGNVDDLIGKAVQVEVGTTSGGKAKIVSVSPLMKGMIVGELENETAVFELGDPDPGVFASLPKFLQERIVTAENWAGFPAGGAYDPADGTTSV